MQKTPIKPTKSNFLDPAGDLLMTYKNTVFDDM
jgi:hypothetical protein